MSVGVRPENDRHDRVWLGGLQLAGFGDGCGGVCECLDFAAVETHAVCEVRHSDHHPKPASVVKGAAA